MSKDVKHYITKISKIQYIFIIQKGRVSMKAQEDVYQEPIILHLNNATVRVFRPVLSDEERARRMKIIHDAAADVLKEVIKNGGTKEVLLD